MLKYKVIFTQPAEVTYEGVVEVNSEEEIKDAIDCGKFIGCPLLVDVDVDGGDVFIDKIELIKN
jgi:hypothetical protein